MQGVEKMNNKSGQGQMRTQSKALKKPKYKLSNDALELDRRICWSFFQLFLFLRFELSSSLNRLLVQAKRTWLFFHLCSLSLSLFHSLCASIFANFFLRWFFSCSNGATIISYDSRDCLSHSRSSLSVQNSHVYTKSKFIISLLTRWRESGW